MTITQEQLEEWKALAEKATPGPWRLSKGWVANPLAVVDTQNVYGTPDVGVVAHVVMAAQDGKYSDALVANSAFIAASREALPSLVSEVERLREALRDIRDRPEALPGLPTSVVESDMRALARSSLPQPTGKDQ